MSKLQIVDMKGASVGDFEIADDLLVLKKGAQAVHDAVVAYMAGQRSGTASTLRKGEVAGSNKKPWRQKGTGRARSGYRQSPVWRGGGVAFGPHPRCYQQNVPRNVLRLAFRRALSERIAAGDVKILSELSLPEAKTKAFAGLMKGLGGAKGALVVVDRMERSLALASRNIPEVEVATARNLNIYQVMRYPLVIVTKTAMEALRVRLEGGAGRAA